MNRTPQEDRKIALHEGGHVVVGRALGGEIGGATITPTEFFAGRVWGPNGGPSSHLGSGFDICAEARPYMPGLGEARTDCAELLAHATARAIESVAGSASEKLFYPADEPLVAIDDQRQARAFAGLFCLTPSAVDQFLIYATSEATALLSAHRATVQALADALLAKRTLDAAEIDRVIAEALAREDLAAERSRRIAWAKTLASSAASGKFFEAEPAIGLLVVKR